MSIQEAGQFIWGSLSTFVGFLIKEAWANHTKTKSLAAALLADVESLEEGYYFTTQGEGVKMLYRDNLVMSITLTEDYFVFFSGNANKIDIFPADDVTTIVRFYSRSKSMIDTLKCWNDLVTKFVEASDNQYDTNCFDKTEVIFKRIEDYFKRMVEYEDNVKVALDEVKTVLNKHKNRTFVGYLFSFCKKCV